MIRIAFNEGDKAALNYERYNHPHPFVQQKMEVLWLKSQGMKHKDICRMADVCSTTLTSYVKEYAEGGIEALKTVKFNRPRSELDDHRGDCRKIGGQAAIAISGDGSLAGWNFCP